jgi:hypothetical protein
MLGKFVFSTTANTAVEATGSLEPVRNLYRKKAAGYNYIKK